MRLIANLLIMLLLGCTAGGDTAFTPTAPTPIDEVNEANLEAVIENVTVVPGNYTDAQIILFTLTTPKKAYFTGSPLIEFNIDSSTYSASYSGSLDLYTHQFSYSVGSNLTDLNGIDILSPVNLNGGTFKDILDENFDLNFSPPNGSAVRVDSKNPSISSITKPADGSYGTTEQLDFIVNFDESINVSGTPRIEINANTGVLYANYLSGSGSSSLIFRLTVALGNDDNDGINLLSPLNLNSGSLRDSFNNNSLLSFTPPNTSGILLKPYGSSYKLIFTTQPSTPNGRDVDFTIQPSVTVKDQWDNTVLDATETITLLPFTDSNCTTPATGTLDLNTLAPTSGVANFSGVDYNQSETIYIQASGSGLVSDCSNSVEIQALPATQVVFSSYPGATAVAGSVFATQPIVEVQDASNSVVTDATNTITIYAFTDSLCSSPAIGSLNSNTQAASSGITTFTGMNYTSAESIYLQATSSGLTSDCEAVAINVSPAAASKVVFNSYPGAAATAGVNFATQPVVEIQDAFNNIVTSSSDIININAFNDASCSISAAGILTSNSLAATSGVSSFVGMNYDKAETIYLEASSGALTSDCEAVAINVQPASAAKVIFATYPGAAATAGVDFATQAVVEIQDTFNNIVTSSSDIVNINAFTDASCSIAASGILTSNSVAAASGVSSFAGMDYNIAETIYLEASSGALTSDCEAVAINVQPGSATQVLFTSYPGAAANAGVDFTTQPIVEIRDAFNNIDTFSSDIITINAFTDSICSVAASGSLTSNSLAATSGIASFTGMDYDKAETIYLEASSGALTSDCEAVAINVSPGAATQVVFTTYPGSPYDEDTDFSIQPIAEIRDAFNNLVNSSDTVNITAFTDSLCSVAAGGILNSNSLAAVAGIASFSGIDYDTPETIFLEASSGALTKDCEGLAIIINDITPPGDPTGVGLAGAWVTGISPDSPTLSWTNPIDPDFSHAEAALGTGVGLTDIISYELTDNATNHIFNSPALVECSTTYYSTVRAVDTSSNASAGTNMPSGFKYDNTNPNTPVINFVFNDHNGTESSNIQWTAATDNCVLDHYEMAVSSTTDESGIIAGGGWTDVGNVTISKLTGLTINLGSTYYTLLKSVDEAGLESGFTASAGWTYVLPPDSITDLATAEVKQTSVELSWTPPNDNGNPITDYVVEYRLNPSGDWSVFPDGVNTDTNLTVTGLTDDTTYDFRVKAVNGSGASFSNIVTESTLITHPFFDPNAIMALNLGGATVSSVVAMEDTTTLTLNGAPLVVLNKGETFSFASALNDIISSDKAMFVAGRLGAGANVNKGNITWNIPAWAGKEFLFNGSRDSEHVYTIYAFEATTVDIYRGGILQATQAVSADSNFTFRFTTNGTYHVFSTGFITGYVYSEGGANNRVVDPYPVLPVSKDMIGFPSNRAQFGSVSDGNSYNAYHSDSNSATPGTFNTGNLTQINPTGGTTTLYQSNALRVIANDFITGRSNADANGNCSAAFLPVSMQRKRYALNVEAEWVAFASDVPGTITIYPPGGGSSTVSLTRTGTDLNAPYKVRLGITAAGHVFESDVRMGGWYEPRTDTDGADDDETIMFGFD